MAHSVVYNGKRIEDMDKPALLLAMEAVCGQLENCKKDAKYWEVMYKTVVKGVEATSDD